MSLRRRLMRPKCRACGKKLAENVVSVTRRDSLGEGHWKTKEEIRQHANDHAGHPVNVVSFSKYWISTAYNEDGEIETEFRSNQYTYKYQEDGYDGYSYGTGRYGYMEQGLFCKLRCGYDYAVAKLRGY